MAAETDSTELKEIQKSTEDMRITEEDKSEGSTEANEIETETDDLASDKEVETAHFPKSKEITKMATLEEYKVHLKIDPFYGNPKDFKRFIEEYELKTEAANYDDHLKNKRLPSFVKNNAKDLLADGKKAGKCETWENTKEFLNKFLGDPCMKLEKKRYKNRQQRKHESVYFYGFDLKDMGGNIGKSESSIINKFLKGLRLSVQYQLEIEFSQKTLKGKQLDDYINRGLEIEPIILKYEQKTERKKDYRRKTKRAKISNNPQGNDEPNGAKWNELVNQPKISTFSGEPVDLKRFIMTYEMKTEAADWDDDLRNRRLPLFIGKKALRSLILGNNFGKCETWENTKDFLNKCLGDPDLKLEKERYKNRQQKEGENACLYGFSLRKMGRNIGKSETSIINKFLKGLNQEKVRHKLEKEFANKTLASREFDHYMEKAQEFEQDPENWN